MAAFVTIRINDGRRAVGDKRVPDTVTRTTEFEVLDESARFLKASVKRSQNAIVPTVWSVFNTTTGKTLNIEALPTTDSDLFGIPHSGCVLEFLDHSPFNMGDRIIVESVYYTVKGQDFIRINQGKSDFVSFSNMRDAIPEGVTLKMIVPKSLGNFRLVQDERCCGITTSPSEVKFTRQELSSVGPDSAIIGFKVESLERGARFYATIVKVS